MSVHSRWPIAAVLCWASVASAQSPAFVPAPGSPFPAGQSANSAVASDFNGDGNQDLAFGNGTVLFGNGSGGFTPAVGPALPSGSIAAADFNHDGRADLAIVNGQGLSVFLGNANGTFTAAQGNPVPSPSGTLALADFNNDGALDLAVLSNQGVSILFGDGHGGFSAAPAGGVTLTGGTGLVAADLNGDGKIDLAVAVSDFSGNPSAKIYVFLGSGTGAFTSAQTLSLSTVVQGASLAYGDFNGDGRPDLAVLGQSQALPQLGYNSIAIVLFGNGTGVFSTGPANSLGLSTGPVTVADFNGDGKLDIASTEFLGGKVDVLLGNGIGFSQAPGGPFPFSGFNPIAVVSGDFNNDGRPDLAVATSATQNATVLLNTITPPVVPPPFGVIDTPFENLQGVTGAVAMTGWALGRAGVKRVALWRETVAAGTVPVDGNPLAYVVDAILVPGARPDVAAAYPGYPSNSSGWGAQILTNLLPSGDGAYRIHAIATDSLNQSTDLGARTFTTDNAHAVLPFGTIDTPQAGGVISGSNYVNFGWALTPNPSSAIPKDGSTILVYIDNFPVGHPVYNNYRVDVATAFPGLQNSAGPVGYFVFDTTKLANGLHSISWSVTDDAGHTQGLGSRLFTVQN